MRWKQHRPLVVLVSSFLAVHVFIQNVALSPLNKNLLTNPLEPTNEAYV